MTQWGVHMSGDNEKLFDERYRHFDELIWQVPSWAIAIAAGVVLAANEIGKSNDSTNPWSMPVEHVQALVLAFGFVLCAALTIALYKYRIFQASTLPRPLPVPPFRQPPKAARYLQGAMSAVCGGLLGLALSQLFPSCVAVFWIAVVLGIVCWVGTEICAKEIIEKINLNAT